MTRLTTIMYAEKWKSIPKGSEHKLIIVILHKKIFKISKQTPSNKFNKFQILIQKKYSNNFKKTFS